MNVRSFAQRFLAPRWGISLYYFLKYRARISTRAEVQLSPQFRIGRHSEISSFTKIKASYGPLTIGSRSFIASGCFVASHRGGLVIGDDCLVSPGVTIVASNFNYSRMDIPIWTQGSSSKGIRIGDNVWIGSGACIMDGADIGSGAIVAANSVVSGHVPANAIVQGNPAKVVFFRR
jgi:acetyltransferase-like isoleucine patch superfamily enzyme